MKPSERIKEILTKHDEDYPNYTDNPLKAVVDYLDEQYEADELARQELRKKLVDMD